MNHSSDEKDYLFHTNDQDNTEDVLIQNYRSKREEGRPHAYLAGKVEFHDVLLKVTSDCLIPRLESELLVERALGRFPSTGKILDLCAGSGALGLAIKKLRPSLDVTLADVSEEALVLVKENAKINQLDITMLQGDFLEPLEGKRFDGIICNPPYITFEEYKNLDPSVRDYEPKIALVGGEDGLKFYKLLAENAHRYLIDGGTLCLEIGKDQAGDMIALFSDDIWINKKVEKDYSSHDRFFFLEKRNAEI